MCEPGCKFGECVGPKFQDSRGKPAAKVSTIDHGGDTDLPQGFQNQLRQCSGVWDTV